MPDAELAAAKRALREWSHARPVPRGAAASWMGSRAAAHLLALPELQRARQVALFAALPDEPPTRALFEALVARGRLPLLPRVAAWKALEFVPVARWEMLRPGRLGVLEPVGSGAASLGPADLVVVPGLGFDRRGRRLGRGAGYYDRTFPPGAPAPRLVGYAWSCRVVDEIPAGFRDRSVDAMVTELGVFRATGGMEEGHGF